MPVKLLNISLLFFTGSLILISSRSTFSRKLIFFKYILRELTIKFKWLGSFAKLFVSF